MKRLILFAFVLVLGCHGSCPKGQKRSNGVCCKNDQYYSKSRKECRDCKCQEPGSKGGEGGGCNDDGQCYCYDNYEGGACQDCKSNAEWSNDRCCKKDQYYNIVYRKCRDCKCVEPGSKGGKGGGCDGDGKCYCYVDYAGDECQKCDLNAKWSNGRCCRKDQYYHKGDRKCQDCKCEGPGAKGGKRGECDESGECYCDNLYVGDRCQRCKGSAKRSHGYCCPEYYYFRFKDKKCVPKKILCYHCDSDNYKGCGNKGSKHYGSVYKGCIQCIKERRNGRIYRACETGSISRANGCTGSSYGRKFCVCQTERCNSGDP